MIRWLPLLLLATRTDAQTADARDGLVAGGMSRTDADGLLGSLDAGRAAVAEVARRDAAAEQARTDAAKPETVAAARAADLTAKLAFANERAPLIAAAQELKLDAATYAALDNAALRKMVVTTADPTVRKDGSDAFYEAAFDLFGKAHRSDAAAVYRGLGKALVDDGAGGGDRSDGADRSKRPANRFDAAFEDADPHGRKRARA